MAKLSSRNGPLGWGSGLRHGDRYGTVLLLIVASIVLTTVASEIGDVTRFVWLALIGSALLFALSTSGAPVQVVVAAAALVSAALLTSAASRMLGAGALATAFDDAVGAVLLVTAAGAIGRRLVRHPVIGTSTVFGAICVYLIVGLFFASAFGLLGAASGRQVFTSPVHATTVDYLYFSFSTLTTVGYGDLLPRDNLTRMLAVSEALIGQVYLVTVIAFLAANIGHARRTSGDSRTASQPERDERQGVS